MAGSYASVLDMIGNTPVVEVRNIDTGPCRLFLKLESQNPGGSIKDRIGRAMIAGAERDGRLKPGGVIVEATAGNTGLGLALVAALKGYKLIVVMPDKMSAEKMAHLRALGAQIVLTRSDVEKGHPAYYQDLAQSIVDRTPGAWYVNQFENPDNPRAHYETTGPEIWSQMDGKVDAFVAGVGSGGTISGTGRFLKEKNPKLEIVLADPVGSVLADLINTGVMPQAGSWLVEGIGEDFIPANLNLSIIDAAIAVSDATAFATVNELLRKEGILAGSSSGTLIGAALEYCRAQAEPKNVVSFVCDTGNKYLGKAYDQAWLADQGLVARGGEGDLRDLIARRADKGEVIAVAPDEPLATAFARMRMFDISQLPVLKDGAIVGLVDESDILFAVEGGRASFKAPADTVMTTALEKLPPSGSIADLTALFAADKVAIVADDATFYGLITKVDLINHLRRKAL